MIRSYASSKNAFPPQATVAPGLTFVVDSLFDYEYPWHGQNAVSPLLAWMRGGGWCAKPERLSLCENGEVVRMVGRRVDGVLKAVLGGEVVVDGLEGYGEKVVCFEKVG